MGRGANLFLLDKKIAVVSRVEYSSGALVLNCLQIFSSLKFLMSSIKVFLRMLGFFLLVRFADSLESSFRRHWMMLCFRGFILKMAVAIWVYVPRTRAIPSATRSSFNSLSLGYFSPGHLTLTFKRYKTISRFVSLNFISFMPSPFVSQILGLNAFPDIGSVGLIEKEKEKKRSQKVSV